MPWLKLKFRSDRASAERLAEALEEAGAISVTLEDAADEPLLELAWEARPDWSSMFVTGLFPADADIPALLAVLTQRGALVEPISYETEALPDRDWERAWMDRWQPMQVGRRLWIVPSWHAPRDPDAVNVILDPGLAFGTGTHPTTAMCLQWLSEQDLAGKTILDVGCGSGILAIAALKLGARRAIGTDIDARALAAARENAGRNDVADRLETFLPDELGIDVQADGVVANILAGALVELAPQLLAHTAPGGFLLLSGIMTHQVDEVRRAYEPAIRFELRTCESATAPSLARGPRLGPIGEEWALLAGRRDTG